MVQKTAVTAQSAALPRAGTGARPLSANSCDNPTRIVIPPACTERRERALSSEGSPVLLKFNGPAALSWPSNRHTGRLEHDPTHRKQRPTVHSNRHNRGRADFTIHCVFGV